MLPRCIKLYLCQSCWRIGMGFMVRTSPALPTLFVHATSAWLMPIYSCCLHCRCRYRRHHCQEQQQRQRPGNYRGSTLMWMKTCHKAIANFATVPNKAGASAIFKLLQARPALWQKRLKPPPTAAVAAVAATTTANPHSSPPPSKRKSCLKTSAAQEQAAKKMRHSR